MEDKGRLIIRKSKARFLSNICDYDAISVHGTRARALLRLISAREME